MYEREEVRDAGDCPQCGSARFLYDGKPVCPDCTCYEPVEPSSEPRGRAVVVIAPKKRRALKGDALW